MTPSAAIINWLHFYEAHSYQGFTWFWSEVLGSKILDASTKWLSESPSQRKAYIGWLIVKKDNFRLTCLVVPLIFSLSICIQSSNLLLHIITCSINIISGKLCSICFGNASKTWYVCCRVFGCPWCIWPKIGYAIVCSYPLL